MRLPNKKENLVGKVCVCTVGRPFIVTGKKNFAFASEKSSSPYWVGLGLDGKGTVASSDPCIIAESGQEFHDELLKMFDGRMHHNA